MAIVLGKPGVDGLSEAVGVLREWQYEGVVGAVVTYKSAGFRQRSEVRDRCRDA
ncbi:hypothetical protein [Streptomyces sp. NPDC101150]|uniref:hypothetical protein n=1 Tax=Streptomyces sp. NPDC101150 TaxID=3366114 RepID=UPI0037FDA3F0